MGAQLTTANGRRKNTPEGLGRTSLGSAGCLSLNSSHRCRGGGDGGACRHKRLWKQRKRATPPRTCASAAGNPLIFLAAHRESLQIPSGQQAWARYRPRGPPAAAAAAARLLPRRRRRRHCHRVSVRSSEPRRPVVPRAAAKHPRASAALPGCFLPRRLAVRKARAAPKRGNVLAPPAIGCKPLSVSTFVANGGGAARSRRCRLLPAPPFPPAPKQIAISTHAPTESAVPTDAPRRLSVPRSGSPQVCPSTPREPLCASAYGCGHDKPGRVQELPLFPTCRRGAEGRASLLAPVPPRSSPGPRQLPPLEFLRKGCGEEGHAPCRRAEGGEGPTDGRGGSSPPAVPLPNLRVQPLWAPSHEPRPCAARRAPRALRSAPCAMHHSPCAVRHTLLSLRQHACLV
eukprot:356655-Chlamydomonas_euryale.AAC.5